jgi:hypothetical protein
MVPRQESNLRQSVVKYGTHNFFKAFRLIQGDIKIHLHSSHTIEQSISIAFQKRINQSHHLFKRETTKRNPLNDWMLLTDFLLRWADRTDSIWLNQQPPFSPGQHPLTVP